MSLTLSWMSVRDFQLLAAVPVRLTPCPTGFLTFKVISPWAYVVIGKGYENPWGTGQGYAWVRVGVSFFDPWQTLTLGVSSWVGRGFG